MILFKRKESASPASLKVSVKTAIGETKVLTFSRSFRIGRRPDCEVCIQNECVSRVHAEVVFEEGNWRVRDLKSSNGLYVGEATIREVVIDEVTTLRLGNIGPTVTFEIEKPVAKVAASIGTDTTVAHYIHHYFQPPTEGTDIGAHTTFVRQAFAKVQTKQKKKYWIIIVALAALATAVGAFALYERREARHQAQMAENLFYTMKSLDLDIANLETLVMDSRSQLGEEEIKKYRSRRKDMAINYDRFLDSLHVYNKKLSEKDRLVLRVARIFGECELDMPPGFVPEIHNYIAKWKSSERLAKAIQTAQSNGYTKKVSEELLAQDLPPQFFYLALQESDFDQYTSGPKTRKGIAKGMWQFIPETALKYGLKLGPLVDLRRPDPGDERDHYELETKAAARYLKDLYSTDAQASGFLVMASYNWGEDQMLPLIRSMPANPKDRNFWRLLKKHRDKIPQETYDYVFYIVSAAVIGENPRLFGFDFDNPLAHLEQ
jgi:membrane-bound lytic murein transglycosylase D